MRLQGRRILITGAASGIGRASAELFVREGARLALLDCNEAGLQSVAAMTGGIACVADIGDEAAVKAAVDKAGERLGGIDGLINSAGCNVRNTMAEGNTALWRQLIEVNLIGTYLVCQYAQRWLAQEDKGTIVNIASGQALLPAPGNSAYGAAKAGIVTMGRALAAELAPRIRVNTIAPGLVNTPMGRTLVGLSGEDAEERLAAFVQQYALKRMAEPEEIAQTLLFLTSWESSSVTGALLAVDGGRTYH